MSIKAISWQLLNENIYRNHQRAFELLSNDLLTIFLYVEPSNKNTTCYSHHIYQLFLRVCTEFEAVCKLACTRLPLKSTLPRKSKDWNIEHYQRLQVQVGNWERDGFPIPSGNLSDYKFNIYHWGNTISPLLAFGNPEGEKSLSWYQDYNKVKHSREEQFAKANLGNLLSAFLGLCAVLDWQGIRTNPWIPEVSDDSIVVGAKFGYFNVGADTGCASRVYF